MCSNAGYESVKGSAIKARKRFYHVHFDRLCFLGKCKRSQGDMGNLKSEGSYRDMGTAIASVLRLKFQGTVMTPAKFQV